MRRTLFGCGWSGALFLLTVLAGCNSTPAPGVVSGQVLYQKKPVPGGIVMFVPTERGSKAVTAIIDESGRYELTAPVGEFKISVDNSELKPREAPRSAPLALPKGINLPAVPKQAAAKQPAPDSAQKPAGKYVEIPEKYYQVERSDLRYTVTSGPQTHNIELK
jgi:hypothetical protein